MTNKMQKNNDKFEWTALDCYNYYNYKKPWNLTRLERIVFKALHLSGLRFETQKTFPWLTGDSGRLLRCDFYIPDKKVVIECHGEQHFKSSCFKIGLNEQLISDESKRYQCEDLHSIKIVYFTECAFKTHLDNDNNIKVFRNVINLIDYLLTL